MKDEAALRTEIQNVVRNNEQMKSVLEERGFEVQTTRIATNSFEEWLSVADDQALQSELALFATILAEHSVMFCSIGAARSHLGLSKIPMLLNTVPVLNSSCDLVPSRDLTKADFSWFRAAAECCLKISQTSAVPKSY
jgi:hypothetical protein